jgi:uncharacterized protein YbjT (DUF2867 family)
LHQANPLRPPSRLGCMEAQEVVRRIQEGSTMILVTGATGLSGAIVIREFARQQVPVRALVRSRAKAQALGLEGLPAVQIVEGDMLRPDTLGAALRGVDRAFVISSARERMVDTQCTFIDAARRAGVRHIVKFSGAESGIGFDPQAFRGTRRHEEIERYLEKSGLAWTHLRPSQFMQLYLREPPTVAESGALIRPMGKSKLSPVDIDDIAKVAVALLRSDGHEGKSYDMTGPEALSMADVAEHMSQVLGETVRYVDIAAADYRAALSAAGTPPDFIDTLDEIYAERRKRPESRVHLATHEALGVQPTTFATFARRNAAAFRRPAVPV